MTPLKFAGPCSTNTFKIVRNGRIDIEKVNGPFLLTEKAMPAECRAGLDHAIEEGRLMLDESGTFVDLADKHLVA